jgi:hypothetical protein
MYAENNMFFQFNVVSNHTLSLIRYKHSETHEAFCGPPRC